MRVCFHTLRVFPEVPVKVLVNLMRVYLLPVRVIIAEEERTCMISKYTLNV